ncbi:CpeR family transcriptional regulator [Geminocystis sp. NIES-3709]|uniref:CpeR family transcriptional regulator n=1 Tax=Geminocystis sp. NIES-3709 TaxID=1617448 RepID=UPI001E4DA19F|nr:CpeR family transcriptional regulator [Geminocystis sp. NIES-3709]
MIAMLPPIASKKMQTWIRSRHLIFADKFLILETFDYSTIERFEECVISLGGEFICVHPLKKVWRGNHRKVILYQAKAVFNNPNNPIKQYWYENGSHYTRFDERC